MRFPRRTKIFFDAEVQLHVTTLEPEPSARGESWRLRNLFHAKQVAVKLSRIVFVSLGHCELDVIESGERIQRHLSILTREWPLALMRLPRI